MREPPTNICPLLALSPSCQGPAVCIKERCAWWLPSHIGRIPGNIVRGRCALPALAYQVQNIADE